MSGPDQDFFQDAFNYTLQNEGGFSNDVGDHGGATRYGITRADATKWYKRPVSVEEMKHFPLNDAEAIYRAWYFDANNCNHMDSRIMAVSIFDIGVVCGIMTSAKIAQKVCTQLGHSIAVDGHIGEKTLAALNEIHPNEFIQLFARGAETRFRTIVVNNASQGKFLKGWVSRAHRLLTIT